MQLRKLIAGWIISSIVMFSLSYLWHGVILNDFNRLDYPLNVYLLFSSFAYLIIGFVISKIYYLQILERFEKRPILRGLAGGAFGGSVIYLFAFVIGISFSGRKLEYILVDLFWQILEQGLGGAAVGVAHIFIHNLGWVRDEINE